MLQNASKRIIIIGATSSIAEHCARLWVGNDSVQMILVGRNLTKTEQIANDLKVRNPKAAIQALTVNFIDPSAIQEFAADLAAKGNIDIVLIAHGNLPDQIACQNNLMACQDAMIVNGISPVLFAEAFASQMQNVNHGTLAVIGSVAGDRGRKSNYVYGAAKGLVTRYVQGLQHRLIRTAVKIVLIKPGPTDTPMTSQLKNIGAKLASVESVAQNIVHGIAKGSPVIYTPIKWLIIMFVIRHLPSFVFNKMDI